MTQRRSIGSTLQQRRATGPLVAALIAIPCGEFALLLADKLANRSKTMEAWVFGYGRWMPGATGQGPDGSIGPYSGKETIAVAVWLIFWAVLHFTLRNSSPNIAKSIRIFLVGLIAVTVNFIDPVADWTFAFVKWFSH